MKTKTEVTDKSKDPVNETACCGTECCTDAAAENTEQKSNEEMKDIVRQKYSEIALQSKETNETSCCGSGCCSDEVYNIMNEEYSALKGYNPDADLGLGCGLPTLFAQIKEGDTVIDLGSGAGNDCFIARAETGDKGKVIGIDFSEVMIEKARANAEKLNYNNIEFRPGEIEKLPVNDNIANVVVSNCVLNLVPDKEKAFKEIFRVLKPGAHFSISDVVLSGKLPEKIRKAAEMYVGCVSGAVPKEDYLNVIKNSGFIQVEIQKEKIINIPDDILSKYLAVNEIESYKNSDSKILSVTVYGVKPLLNKN